MLAKFKTALVLLIIGVVSGTFIWGTHEITRDPIERNRELARLAVYVDMYPTLDPNNIEEETIEHSAVTQKLTFYDNNGNLLGYAFRGSDNNAFGFVNVVVGIDRTGKIVRVAITETSNTTTYVAGIVNNYLPNFANQDIANLSYDSSTGATSTYNSVRRIIEAAILLVAGDPILEQYQTIFDDANRYETVESFLTGTIRQEVAIYDGSNEIIGYVYQGYVTVEGTDYLVGFAVNLDHELLGVISLTDDAPSALVEALSQFDTHLGETVDSITLDLTGDFAATLTALGNHAFMRATEDEDLRALRAYFIEAASIDEAESVEGNRLESARAVRNSSDEIIGYIYIGEASGWNPGIRLEVSVYLDGTVSSVIVLEHDESAGISDPAFNSIGGYIGLDDADDFNADAYAGATFTGDAIRSIIKAAQTDVLEKDGE